MGKKFERQAEFIKEYTEGTNGVYILAKKYGVSATTLSNVLRKNNVVARKQIVSKADRAMLEKYCTMKNEVGEALDKGFANRDIASLEKAVNTYLSIGMFCKQHSCSVPTLIGRLKKEGLKPRKVAWLRIVKAKAIIENGWPDVAKIVEG